MLVGAQVLKDDNAHITNIFLNAGLARKEEVGSIEDGNQEHQDYKDYLKW
jgi:hypothetical protein